MPTNTLTDSRCRSTKPTDKPQKLFDGGGLYLFITTAGAKLWRVAYRLQKKPQTISLGAYPLLSLADARIKRDVIKVQLRDGEDPMAPRRALRNSLTLDEAITAYWGARADVSDDYKNNALKGLTQHLAMLLRRPLAAITREDLLVELMKMNAAGLFVYVRRVRMWVGQVFEWGIEQGDCKINPAALIRPEKAFGKAKVRSHPALPQKDVGPFLVRIAMEKELLSVLALFMLGYTWTRTTELRMMRWTEIEQDDLWRIPENRMKREREHLVPLVRQALVLLKKLRAMSSSEYVFPSDRRLDRPMSENSMLYLVHRCGYKGLMTGHGWRTVASTWANENDYNRDHIERQLAHAPDDETRHVYNLAEYLPQRRKMLQAWADWLDVQQKNPE